MTVVDLLLLQVSHAAPELNVKETVSSTHPIYQHAREKYGPNISIARAESGRFSVLFPAFELYLIANLSFNPPVTYHQLAYHPTLNLSYDISTQHNPLLATAGITILTAGTALDHALMFAAIGNAEEDFQKQLLFETDSEWLGRNVSSPSITQTLGGWDIRAST